MNTFPDTLKPENKKNFKNIYYKYVLQCLRKELYENILKNDEKDYFDIDKFTYKYYKKDIDNMKKLTDDIVKELIEIGWKCKTSFGGTVIFVYSTDKPPDNCWDDSF